MVGDGGCGMPSRSRRRSSKKPGLGLQGMDGGRTYHGLDQHEDYSRCGLLCYRNSYWGIQEMARKRSYGSAVETRPRQLPRYPQAPTRITSNEAVLK